MDYTIVEADNEANIERRGPHLFTSKGEASGFSNEDAGRNSSRYNN
jgi:hypothetical protein